MGRALQSTPSIRSSREEVPFDTFAVALTLGPPFSRALSRTSACKMSTRTLGLLCSFLLLLSGHSNYLSSLPASVHPHPNF